VYEQNFLCSSGIVHQYLTTVALRILGEHNPRVKGIQVSSLDFEELEVEFIYLKETLVSQSSVIWLC
jgi:hypothetical protein